MGLVLNDSHDRQCVHILPGAPRFIQPYASQYIITPSAREPLCDYIVVKKVARESMRHAGVVIRGVPSPKAGGFDCVVRMRSV